MTSTLETSSKSEAVMQPKVMVKSGYANIPGATGCVLRNVEAAKEYSLGIPEWVLEIVVDKNPTDRGYEVGFVDKEVDVEKFVTEVLPHQLLGPTHFLKVTEEQVLLDEEIIGTTEEICSSYDNSQVLRLFSRLIVGLDPKKCSAALLRSLANAEAAARVRASAEERESQPTMRIFDRLDENEKEFASFPEEIKGLLYELEYSMPYEHQNDWVLVVNIQPTEIAFADHRLNRSIKDPIAQSKAIRKNQTRSCFLKVDGEDVLFDGKSVGRVTDESIGYTLFSLLYN